MSKCIKTGARVFIEEYSASVASDIHEANGATIIRFNPHSFVFNADPKHCDVKIELGDGYFDRDDGIIVNPLSYSATFK